MDKKVLLIADDDEMNRKIIHRFLSSTYDVIEAEDGEETLQKLKDNQVDALLLDIIMPKMDGLEALRIIREDAKYDYLGILVATSTKEKTERAALSLGADDIVSKPYDPIVIKKRLENILLMKTVKEQKELLQSHDSEALEKKIRKEYSVEITNSSERLHKIAKVIRNNKDNMNLIAEMADSVDTEANLLEMNWRN